MSTPVLDPLPPVFPPGTPRKPDPTPSGPTHHDAHVTCPTCDRPLPGLLALCWQPACVTAFLDEDARYDQ